MKLTLMLRGAPAAAEAVVEPLGELRVEPEPAVAPGKVHPCQARVELCAPELVLVCRRGRVVLEEPVDGFVEKRDVGRGTHVRALRGAGQLASPDGSASAASAHTSAADSRSASGVETFRSSTLLILLSVDRGRQGTTNTSRGTLKSASLPAHRASLDRRGRCCRRHRRRTRRELRRASGRRAHHCRLDDAIDLQHDTFDLGGGHVLHADLQHVLRTIDEREVTVSMGHDEIARAEPAELVEAVGRRLGLVEVLPRRATARGCP